MPTERSAARRRPLATRVALVACVAVAVAGVATGIATGLTAADRPPGSGVAPATDPQVAQAGETVCSFDGRDVTGDDVALTSFAVSAPTDPPEDGQTMSARFVLENGGQFPVTLESVFLHVDAPDGERDVGRTPSMTLDAGEEYVFETEVTATEGSWRLRPTYENANGLERSPGEPCDVAVAPPPDTEPPLLSVALSPDPPLADDEAVTVTVAATDDSGVSRASIAVDGETREVCRSRSCSATVGPLEPGTHEYRIQVVDGAGNPAESVGTFRVTQPTSPLTVEVDHYVPPPNASLPTVIAARAVGDAEVDSLTILVDGAPVETCASATCLYRERFAPGTDHTFGATATDGEGTVVESAGGDTDRLHVPETRTPALPTVRFQYPSGRYVFEQPDRLAFDVSAPQGLRRVQLHGFEDSVTERRTLCGPADDVPACPERHFEFDEAVSYEGWNPVTVLVDTDDGVHLTAGKDVYFVDPSTVEARINASHEPASPSPGEPVTIRARAETDLGTAAISSVEIRRTSFLGPGTVLESCPVDRRADAVTCETTYEPPSGRHVVSYYAVARLAGDRQVTTDPRPIVFDDGPDRDDDGLTDYEERFLCTDERDPDTDGDALLDGWEVYGHRFPDGHVVDLPAMGAHPCQRDVFLEVDWWGNDTHSHRPATTALTATKQAFRRGGVRLHVDAGKWGGGEETPHHDLREFPPPLYYEDGYEYRLRKAAHFDPHRLWTFHYAVFRHRTGRSAYVYANSVNVQTPDGASWGFETAELFHEFGHAIGLGHGGRRGERLQRREGDLVTYYGGWDGAPNRRPNYLSSMNYLYYGTTYWNADAEAFVRSYDFSRADLPDLDESDLDERPDSEFARALRDYPLPDVIDERPYGVADDWTPVVRYGCIDPDETEEVLWFEVEKPVVVVSDGRRTLARKVAGESWQTTDLPEHPPGIDWNCDGEIEASVEMNVNGDGGDDGLFANRSTFVPGEVLEGREDWSKIPNRHPCPAAQQTERDVPNSTETYEVAPAPSDAFLREGHDPPCSESRVRPPGGEASTAPHRSSVHYDHTRSPTAGKPITAERDELLPAEFCNLLDDDRDGEVDEGCLDGDADGVPDDVDNCPAVANRRQADSDGDYVGDACSGLPPAPADLSAERDGDGVRLTWAPIDGTSGYAVWRRPAPEAPPEYVGDYPTTANESFVDDAADPGESATYVVRAINAMTGTEGRAASVRYEPGDDGSGQSPGTNGGVSVTLVAVAAVFVLVIVGAALYVRRRAG